MDKRKVVVTGIGTVNPIGNNTKDSWEAILQGRHGIAEISRFDTSGFSVKLAGEVKDFDFAEKFSKKEARTMDLFAQYALYAASEAVEMSGLDLSKEKPDERAGCIISSGIGGIGLTEQEHDRGLEKGFERINPHYIPMTIANMAAANVAIRYGLKGMCTCPVTACAGGSNAIGDAFHRIRDGYEDVMICGGTEGAITPVALGGFASMRALSHSTDPDRASIPFDAERSGFVMGEGAGILVLEEEEHAKKRGVGILAEISGYGANCDAYHITAPSPDGEGGAKCMELALKDAGLKPEDIDYINAHGTSTHLNDLGETKAVKAVFGEHAGKLKVSSTKSMTGHLLGGAGGVEAVFCVQALMEGFIPPTVGLRNPDPECDLDYVPEKGEKADLKHVLSNSLGFGGHNACLIFSRAGE